MSDTTENQKKAAPVDESFEPKVVNEFQSEPRGAARIDGIDLDAVDARLTECADFFSKHCDEADYRNLDWYLQRSQLRFAAGDDIFDVIDDMFMAARCLHDRSSMHLDLKPPEMFMTRRIMPVELGIISGMPMLTLEFSATYGLPLMMVLGQTAPESIMGEANLMTSYFRRQFCADFYELAGLCAVIYAGVIAAIGRGFDDEATVALSTYAKARDSLRGNPPASILPKIRRYDCLNTALACLCNGNFDMIGGILEPVAQWFEEDNKKKYGDAFLKPAQYPVPKYYDSAILTILALAALRGKVIELPQTGVIAKYNIFTKGLMEMPERRIEVPGLDEEASAILEQAGVDPDQLSNGYVDNSFHTAKEESEARADALFQEKQREVQRAVREKLAKGVDQEESHLAVEPQKYVHETLKMDDDSVEKSSRFFSDDDTEDDAARRANEESEKSPDDSKSAKDFSSFFNKDDEESRPNYDGEEHYAEQAQGDNDSAKPSKDFSSFFNDDDKEDASLRASVDDERAAEQNLEQSDSAKPAKDFSSFFSNDDAEDDSIREHVEIESTHDENAGEGKNFNSFFDNLDENAIPQYDDGSADNVEENAKNYSFSGDFFNDEKKPPCELKMTLDEDEEPAKPVESKSESKPEAVKSVYEQARESRQTSSVEADFEDVKARDFSKLFESDAPSASYGLKMTLDEDDEKAKPTPAKQVAPKDDRLARAARAALEEREAQLRELEEEQARKREEAFASQRLVLNEDGTASFDSLGAKPADAVDSFSIKTTSIEDERAAQLRELEEEQARKVASEAASREQNRLKLELDDEPEAPVIHESHQERVARLIAERQAAVREQALREREEALRELEELKQKGPQKPVVEQLQLTPDEPTDPEEVVAKVAPEDMVIKGFAYTELDMIHANTAERNDLEEDFDMHAAMAQKAREELENAKNSSKNEEAPVDDKTQTDSPKSENDLDDLIKF